MAYEIYKKSEQALQRDSHVVYGSKPHKSVSLSATANARIEQERNGQDHLRVFDPDQNRLMIEVLVELKKLNRQMELITGEELKDDNY